MQSHWLLPPAHHANPPSLQFFLNEDLEVGKPVPVGECGLIRNKLTGMYCR
jgi:hypothetical protein